MKLTAYAGAISDGTAAELRCRLFRAIWGEGRHLSSAYEVRRLVTRLMWPQEDIGDRLASPGGTITPERLDNHLAGACVPVV